MCCLFLRARPIGPAHTTLELIACVMITMRFSMNIAGRFKYQYDTRPASMAFCILVDSPSLISLGLNGGTASVVIITLDRYWKIVHSIHFRKYYRRWMLYVGLLLPWLNGIAVHLLPSLGTTRIVNGKCMATAFWPTVSMRKVRFHNWDGGVGKLVALCHLFLPFHIYKYLKQMLLMASKNSKNMKCKKVV